MEIHIITLSPLPTEHVLKLVCKYLGIPEMPKRLVPLFEKTKGHPLLSLEMAISLKNSGAFQILQDQEQLQPKLPAAYSLEATFGGTLTNASSPSPNNNVVDPVNSLMSDAALEDILKTFSFSSALHSVISSRIDELKPSQQLTLKVASILGDSFDFNVLHSIYPKNYTKEQLKEDLNVLTKLQFVHSEKKRTRFSSNRTGRARIITYSRNRRHHNYSSTGSGHHRRKHHKKHHKHKKKSKSKSKSKKHSSDSDSFIVETAVEEEEDVAPTQSSKKALPSNLRKSKTIKIAKSANKQRDSSGNATSSENETKQSSKAGKSKSKGKGKEVMTGSEDEATTEEVKKPFSFLSASLKETGQWTASNKSTTAAPAVSERAAPSVVSFDEFEASSGSEKQSSTKRGRSKTSFDKRSSLINSEIEKGAAGLTQEPYGDYYDSGSGSVPVGYHYSSGSGYSSAACSGYGSGGGSSGGSEDGCTVKEVYYFNHLIIWETVYATLLPSQRRQWHKKAAEHYENVLLDLELQTSKRAMALQQQQMSETESGAESGSSYYPTASTSSSHSSSTASTLPSSSPVSSSAGSSPYTASPFSTAAAIISKSLSHAASCYYPMLAYHWNSAGNDLRALLYFQKSGKQALSIFAYQEAVEFYERAIALADRLNALSSASSASTIDSSSSSTSSSTSSSRRSLFFSKSSKSKNQQQQCNSNKNAAHQEISSFRLASWERKLTKAYLSLKKLTKAEQHARKALDLLGQPLSEGNGWFGSTGVEVFRQFAKRKLLGFMSFSSSSSSSSSNKDTPSLKAFKPAVLSGGGGSSGGGANAASDRGDHGMLSMLLKEDPTNATQLELSKCYYLCYKLKFLAEDFTSAFACISRSVKAAESVGRPTKQLARAYAAMCYFSASMYSMRGISRQFARSSIEITNSLVTTLQQNPATDSSTSSSASGSSASSISSVDGSQQEFGGNSRKNAECVMTVLLDTSHIHFTNGNWKVVNARLLKALQVSERYGDRAMKQYILAYYAMYWNMRGKFRRSLKLLEHPCFKEGGGSSLSSSSAETAFFADEQQQHNTSAGLAQSSAAVSTTNNNDDGHHHHNNKKCKKCKKKNKRASSDVSSSSGSSSAVPTTVATTASDSTTTTTNSSNSDTLSSSSSSMKTKKKRSNHHHHHHRHRHSNNKQMVPSSSQEMKGGIRGIVGEDNSISPFSTKIVKAVSLLYLGELNQALDVLREKDVLSSCSKLWKDREHVLRHFVTALIHWCNKEYRASKRLLFYLIEKLRQLTAQANHFVMWSDFETTCFVLELCLSLWDYERYREQMTANKAAAAAAAAAADASSTASSPAPAPTPSPSASILSPSSLLVASSSSSSASSNSSSSASSSNSANFAHQPLPSPSASAPKAGTRELLLAGSANVFLLSKKMIKWEERALKLSRILEKLVKTYPIGQSRYLRLLGLLKWLSGNPKSSTKLWSKSLEEAQIHSMEHERGATHLFMGMYINIGSGSSSSSSSSSNHPSPSFSASASLIGSNHPSHNQPSHHHNQQQQHYNEAAMKRKRGHFKEALSAFELCGAEYFYLLCCNEDMKHDMETEVEREGGYSASFHSSSAQQRRQQQREEEEANDDDRSDSERSSASDSLFTSSLSASTSSLSTTAAVKPKKKSRVRVLTMENSREAKHKRQQQSFLASAAAAAPSSSAAAASSLSSSPSSPPSLTSSSKTSSSSCSSSSARRNIASSGGGGTTTEVDEDDFSSPRPSEGE
ncbi:Histone deacetylase SIR2-like [Balamuthia mandrillaris]